MLGMFKMAYRTPEFMLMSMQRARSIIGKDAKQLARSAKIANTSPAELLKDAQVRIRWEKVPKKDKPYLKMFTMMDEPGARERMIEAMDDLNRHYQSKGFGQTI